MKTPQQIKNEVEKEKKHLFWIIGLIIIISIICGTLIYLNNHPYSFKIEMDDNTLEAIKSINFSELYNDKPYFCNCGVYNKSFMNYDDLVYHNSIGGVDTEW